MIAQQTRPTGSAEQHLVAAITNVLTAHGDRFPALSRAISQAAADEDGQDQAFEFGVERIPDGLQALIENRNRRAEPPSPHA